MMMCKHGKDTPLCIFGPNNFIGFAFRFIFRHNQRFFFLSKLTYFIFLNDGLKCQSFKTFILFTIRQNLMASLYCIQILILSLKDA